MPRSVLVASVCSLLALAAPLALAEEVPASAPVERPPPPAVERPDPRPPPPPAAAPAAPAGELLAKHRAKLKARASSVWSAQWSAKKAIDGDPATSWFSADGDAAALGKQPWIEVLFPEDVSVARVMALGNREPDWPRDYSVIVARVELYDAAGRRLAAQGNESGTPAFDIEFRFPAPVAGVRRLRLVSLSDQGDRNPYRDIAVGELRAW